jgi:predicted ester cyclase
MTITTRSNQQTALRALELICAGDTGPSVEDLIHPACVDHRHSGRSPGGRDGFRAVVRFLSSIFADISITPLDVIAEGDKVVARTRFSGLHVGAFGAVAASHRTIECDQIHIWRLEDGLIAEHWMCMDEVGSLRQMGAAVPETH